VPVSEAVCRPLAPFSAAALYRLKTGIGLPWGDWAKVTKLLLFSKRPFSKRI
jgi:hypothetical protein